MTRVCEKYRERALKDGLNSRAGEIWRRHSRNCPQCRTEIYLLSMLGETVSDSRQHISRKDYEQLLEEVREHSSAAQPLRTSHKKFLNLHFSGQVAAALAVFFFVAVSGSWSRIELWDGNACEQTVMSTGRQLSAASLEEHLYDFGSFVVGNMPGVFSAAEKEPAVADSHLDQAPFWDSSMERAFFDLRDDIENQCLFYSDMIDRELQE